MAAFVPAVSLRSSINNQSSISKNVTCTRDFISTTRATNTRAVRMIAAEPVKVEEIQKTELSLKALTLISYLRGHKSLFRPGKGFTAMTRALCVKNDTVRLFTPPDQLKTNESLLPGVSVANYMYSNSDQMLDLALETTSTKFSLAKDDEVIRDIVKYNFHACFRSISYGAACQSPDFIDQNNVSMMKDLNVDIGVPSDSLVVAFDAVKDLVVSQIDSNDDQLVKGTSACFDSLRDALC